MRKSRFPLDLTAILCGLLFAAAVHPQAIQPDQFQAWIRSSPAPGVHALAPGVHRATEDRTKPLFLAAGRFDGKPDAPIILQGAGMDQTIIECPEVCYFSRSEYVELRDLTIRGYINSDHMRHWRFTRVRWDDPDGIGPRNGQGKLPGIVFKAASSDGPNDPDPGSGPLSFEDNIFEPHPEGIDTALDFVGTQGVELVGNTWSRCNRGCLQAKGGAGIIAPYVIAYNLILDAGDRGIFLGGSTDAGRYHPPVNNAAGEFGGADVRGNIVLGGKACATFASLRGPVRFHHNFCRGASAFQVRMLVETEYPAFRDAGWFRNLAIDHNVFADWTGNWDNTFQSLIQVGEKWGAASNQTIQLKHNLFNHWTGERSWRKEWAQEGNIQVKPEAMRFSVDGRSVVSVDGVDNWPDYGPRPVAVPPVDHSMDGAPVFMVLWPDGRVLFYPDLSSAADAAENGGIVARILVSGAGE